MALTLLTQLRVFLRQCTEQVMPLAEACNRVYLPPPAGCLCVQHPETGWYWYLRLYQCSACPEIVVGPIGGWFDSVRALCPRCTPRDARQRPWPEVPVQAFPPDAPVATWHP